MISATTARLRPCTVGPCTPDDAIANITNIISPVPAIIPMTFILEYLLLKKADRLLIPMVQRFIAELLLLVYKREGAYTPVESPVVITRLCMIGRKPL